MRYIEEKWRVEGLGKLSFIGCDPDTGKIKEIGRVFITTLPGTIKAVWHNWTEEFGDVETSFSATRWTEAMLWIERKARGEL